MLAASLRTDGSMTGILGIYGGGSRHPPSAGLTATDVNHVIAHQANKRIIESAMQNLGVPLEKCWINIDRYGNTSSASMPITLDEANRAGRLKKGDVIAMMAIGAGMTWGGAVLRW